MDIHCTMATKIKTTQLKFWFGYTNNSIISDSVQII